MKENSQEKVLLILNGLQNKIFNLKKSQGPISQLEIVENLIPDYPLHLAEGEITISLSNDIKLTVPLHSMAVMIQILKEHWHVSRG